jgi:flagellar basal body rod protein FlgG
MFLNASMSAALDRIAERASDVRRAFDPGAVPAFDDVAAPSAPVVTLDPLSAAIPNDAYLIVRGEKSNAYTRDGSLSLRDGRLLDAAGRPVLGTATKGGPLVELGIDPVDATLGRASSARVEADGSLTYERWSIDPRSGAREAQRVVAGRVALARFPAGTRLEPARADSLVAPAGVAPHVGAPADGSFAALQTMHRTGFGVDVDASLARLKDAYVAFDALQAAEAAKGHLGKTALDLLK